LTAIGCGGRSNPYGYPDKGTISGNTYSNEFFGLSFPLPEGWYVLSEGEVAAGISQGINFMAADNPQARAAMQHWRELGAFLLMIQKYPMGTPRFNPNIVIGAEDVAPHIRRVNSGADYLRAVSDEFRQLKPQARITGPIEACTLGGRSFHQINIVLPIDGFTAHQRMYATLTKNHILLINITAESNSGLNELAEIVQNVAFEE